MLSCVMGTNQIAATSPAEKLDRFEVEDFAACGPG